MIIISLMGGLGNQMFQYASAKRLAQLNKTPLKIDSTHFGRLTANKEHTFQLTEFCISAPQATKSEIRKLLAPSAAFPRMASYIAGFFGRSPYKWKCAHLYREPAGTNFKPEFLELKDNTYLLGYFNSYKYFSPIRDDILKEYMPSRELSPTAQAVLKEITAANSVSLHIRRGDYVEDPKIYKTIDGIITEQYYRNAVNHVAARVDTPLFFIFSNDMTWAKENFRLPHATTYVDFNSPQRGFEDLWLMSRCKHNILAGGSTFSWWAAYLNTNPDKIVIRTKNINNDPAENQPEDYFPPEWVAVNS